MPILENKILRFFLLPISLIYSVIIELRNLLYDFNILPVLKLSPVKIISVGNITVGGTGKTPFCKYLAQQLKSRGLKVVILSRGYKRQSKGTVIVSDGLKILATPQQTGDEPYLLATELKDVPVVVETDRYQGALLAQQKFHPDVILLDDAFQHRHLARDLDIVLIDAVRGLDSSWVLPAGLLREPLRNLRRADLFCLTRAETSTSASLLLQKIQTLADRPIMKAAHEPSQLFLFDSSVPLPLNFLNGKKALLFAGIANPASFEQMVLKLGAQVTIFLKFPDHHHYAQPDLEFILKQAKKSNSDLVLTTQKDYIHLINNRELKGFYYLTIEMKIFEGEKILENKISDLIMVKK